MFTASISSGFFRLTLFIGLITALSGCSLFQAQTADTEEAYYDAAQTYLENRNYSLAIERLETLLSRFPFGRYTAAANYDLMYARFQSNDFSGALINADRFIRLNPNEENVEYAWYVRAMSFYELYLTNRGIFSRGDPAQRSPEQGKRAFDALSEFTELFPKSQNRAEALSAMVVLKDALARHELIVADFYLRKQAWVAAAERAQAVTQQFPGVSAQADAYVILIEAYEALGLSDDRALALAELQQNFPSHPTLASGNYRSPRAEQDRWWLKLLTLGLMS